LLALVQLIGEGRHVGAFDTEAQGAVDRVEAQVIQPRRITQIGRRRRQTNARRAIPGTRVAVAHRTMLSVQRRTTGRVRRNDRRLADFIGHRQLRAKLPCLTGDVRTVLSRSNGVAQRADTLLQSGFFWLGRHRGDQALQCLDKCQLLLVFGFIDDLARLHRFRVIRTDVIEQMQRLWRAFNRVGQQVETAQGKQRQHQPGQETGRGSHE
jgi:hypothetical protein